MCIEITNICDAHCRLCPIGQGYRPRKVRGFMPIETFESIIDAVVWHVHTLGLYNWGEPMLHPQIFDMVRLARDRGLSTHVSTNMLFLKRSAVTDLVDCGLDLLIVSVHAMSQESYEAYQPGKRIDEPLDAVREILAYKKKTGSQRPEVQLHFVVHRKNEHEIPALIEFAERIGITYALTPVSLNVRFLDRDKNMARVDRPREVVIDELCSLLNEWLPSDARFVNPYYARLRNQPDLLFSRPERLNACDWLWRQCIIAVDGDVMPCCGAYHESEALGNILQAPLAQIWNSAPYQAAREAYVHRQANHTVCSWCSGMLL